MDAIARLIDALQILPGVGPKGAQRMALHLLQHNRNGAGALANALTDAVQHVRRCRVCRTLSTEDLCGSMLG